MIKLYILSRCRCINWLDVLLLLRTWWFNGVKMHSFPFKCRSSAFSMKNRKICEALITGMMIRDCENMTLTLHFMWPWTWLEPSAVFPAHLPAPKYRKNAECVIFPSVSGFYALRKIATTSSATSVPRHLSQTLRAITNTHILYI